MDVQIQVINNAIKTTVYRKPEATPVIIPKWSEDKWSYKKAALRSYVKRAFTHCNDDNLRNEEIDKIKNIAAKHGYGGHLI